MRKFVVFLILFVFLSSTIFGNIPARAMASPEAVHSHPANPITPTIMNLVMLNPAEYPNAVCNDGTLAGYYFLAGTGSGATTWVIHLQGGGQCFSDQSCRARKKDPSMQNLISSKNWTQTLDMTDGGIMSADSIANPYFYNANHVYIPYCSSDLTSGDADTTLDNAPWHFRGHTIFQSILKNLGPQIKNATKVLLVGGSAGGVGVLVNLDAFAEQLKTDYGITYVKGLADASWFLEVQPFNPSIPTWDSQIQQGYIYWKAQGNLDPNCTAANPSLEWRCYIGSYVYHYVSTPLFVYNSQFDVDALALMGDVYPYTPDGYSYRDAYGKDMVASLSQDQVNPVFAPDSYYHSIADHAEFDTLRVENVSLSDMLGPWFFNLPGPTRIIESRIDLPISEINYP